MNKPHGASTVTDLPIFNVEQVRADFPILQETIKGKPLVYLDNAATAQKPLAVIETVDRYYREYNSNIHRGVHTLSQVATEAYEKARDNIKTFINARSSKEIIFVRGATEAINLVAQSYGRPKFGPGDEILITESQPVINDAGELIMEEYDRLLSEKTKLVAVLHISNALGTINPIESMIEKAHAVGSKVLIDGAQAVPHKRIDVSKLDCDFYVFSGHKLFGPTGIGVLYGKQDLLEAMPPYQGGGDMIKIVSMDRTVYNDLPHKFEAGTPHIAGVIGLGAAVDYVEAIDFDAAANYEIELLNYAVGKAEQVEGMNLIGTAANKTSILSFTLDGIHPHDIGTILDDEGVAIRAGHHCAMPIMERYSLPATARASFAFYNTYDEVDALFIAIEKCKKVFG